MKKLWQQFRPRGPRTLTALTVEQGGEMYQRAQRIVDENAAIRRKPWQNRDVSLLNPTIDSLRTHAENSGEPALWLAVLVMQAPRAAQAQSQMDKHPQGYHNKQARLYELIDFNDTYVSAVLSMPEEYLPNFNDTVKRLCDQFCKRMKAPCFSNEQWEAVTHGLSREIAVYRGALSLGYEARMTSRREDAMGVDMVVTDPAAELSIGLDIKTRSSFHFRLVDLHREGRISELQREEGEKFGHLTVVNGHGQGSVVTTLLRIDEEIYGRMINFSLERLDALDTALKQIFRSFQRR